MLHEFLFVQIFYRRISFPSMGKSLEAYDRCLFFVSGLFAAHESFRLIFPFHEYFLFTLRPPAPIPPPSPDDFSYVDPSK